MTTLTAPAQPAASERLLRRTRDRSYRSHIANYGPLPRLARRDSELLAEIDASGLTGRGGAGFPTARKLATVAGRRRTAVIANGTEGEPASYKDQILLTHNPHLVLDGLLVAASLIGAREITIAVANGTPGAHVLANAIAERPERQQPRLALVADCFVAGEETALVSAAEGGAGLPTGRRPFADGTLVQNVETLANLALIVRYGADWFRGAGTENEPGTALATVSGAVASPGVLEFEFGTRLGEIFDRCGGLLAPVNAVLIGGYFGRWVRADRSFELTNAALRRYGGSLGARVIFALPRSTCGLVETSRVVHYLAGESAGQCGPCVFGLPALAEAMDILNEGRHTDAVHKRLSSLRAQIAGRGACHHPDGTLGFIGSALEVFAAEVESHRRGICTGSDHRPVLPTESLAREIGAR